MATSTWFQQHLPVSLSFPVWFGGGLFHGKCPAWTELWARFPRSGSERLLLAVESAALHYHPHLPEAFRVEAARASFPEPPPPLVLPGGEPCKDGLAFVDQTTRWLAAAGACRHSFLVAVGGGAFLDMIGLAAGLWHRGVRLIRVPTTLLAQADSGVGVKNAVNWAGHKNGLGTFAAPAAVLNSTDFLASLPTPILRDGMAEAFKVALIKDADFFRWLCAHAADLATAEPSIIAQLARRSALLHLDHIRRSDDPFETGTARPLDFGHWLAHELERQTNYTLPHGRAVAIGVFLDAAYAAAHPWLEAEAFAALQAAWETLELPSSHPALFLQPRPLLSTALDRFREHLGGQLSLTFPDGLGKSQQISTLDLDLYCCLIKEIVPRSSRT